MGFWLNCFNLIICIYLWSIWTTNSNIITFFLWTEIIWIFIYLLTITLASFNTPILLAHLFYILTCTVLEISFTSVIYLNIFTRH